jgi:hypothetical protein
MSSLPILFGLVAAAVLAGGAPTQSEPPAEAPPRALTPAQLEDVGRKHGVRFKH